MEEWTKMKWEDLSLETLQGFLDGVDNMPGWELDIFLEWADESLL
jgi:hypothetical protein